MNVCRWAFPGTWVHDVASSWRISPDINASWGSVKSIIRRNLYLSAYAGEGRYNDMDMLEIGRGLSEAEEQTHFGMWCMMSSPLLIGCDLTAIPEKSLRLLLNPELIAINQDALGLQARVYRQEQGVVLLAKDIREAEGRTRAVALYNPTDEDRLFSFCGTDIGLEGSLNVRDALARRDVPEIKDGQQRYILKIPAHSVRIFRMEGERRMETTRYEAEWAWLNRYQELWNTGEQIGYMEEAGLSGGAGVSRLGKEADNWMEWRDVYSPKGGKYTLTLHYICAEDRDITVTVNGKKSQKLKSLNSGSDKQTARKEITIRLKQGYNTIRLGNDKGWAPDIDCITLNMY